MLESTLGYVDYWVVQDNGSTDGSDKIAIEYFEEHNIPYHYYQCEEGGLVLDGTETIFSRLV